MLLDALRDKDIAWRAVLENDNIEATRSTVRADVAVTAWLASTVPAGLEILGVGSGLPELPDFSVNLHVRHRAEIAVDRMAEQIRSHFLRGVRLESVLPRVASPALEITWSRTSSTPSGQPESA